MFFLKKIKISENKYLVFQTWRGGFNNERMSLELAIVFAICLGRNFKYLNLINLFFLNHSFLKNVGVLVLPPMFDMYLLEPSHLGDYFSVNYNFLNFKIDQKIDNFF